MWRRPRIGAAPHDGHVPPPSIIGIPFGIQSFKLAALALAPFGKKIVDLDELPGYVPPTATAA